MSLAALMDSKSPEIWSHKLFAHRPKEFNLAQSMQANNGLYSDSSLLTSLAHTIRREHYTIWRDFVEINSLTVLFSLPANFILIVAQLLEAVLMGLLRKFSTSWLCLIHCSLRSSGFCSNFVYLLQLGSSRLDDLKSIRSNCCRQGGRNTTCICVK